jgi:molybdenum cofactor synthesis domain-containing protein
MFRVGIITASDSGYAGKREDESGTVIKEIVEANGYEVTSYVILPDDRKMLADEMKRLCDNDIADLVLTTGGTGFSPRDCTPEATLDIAEKQVPGIAEAMRYSSMQITKRAMLSRALAAIRGKTLIVNLPGSPKAVRENLEFIIGELPHGLEVLKGHVSNCARK